MVPTAMRRATADDQTPYNDQNASTTRKLRKYILLLASLVATVTYAAAFSPPGDVWQDTAADHIAGDPIIRDTHHRRYLAFFYCNATAFAASIVVIVLVLIFAYLDDKGNRAKYCNSMFTLRTLQTAMVVDLLSLMGAYAAGTCRDTFTTAYSVVLVVGVVLYLVFQMTGSGGSPASSATGNPNSSTRRGMPEGQVEGRHPVPDDAPAASPATGNPNSSSGGGVPQGQVEGRHPVPDDTPASPATGNPNSSSGGGVPEPEPDAVRREEPQKAKGSFRSMAQAAMVVASMSSDVDKTKEQFRKVLMLLATFAVSITYSAGLSTPGGFWDTTGPGHGPGDAILKDRHSTRLAAFLCFNTLAFVASLLIIVVLLDTKPHYSLRRVFIVVALCSLIGAYNAGSCRETDTTVYVGGLIAAVVVYILLLLMVASGVEALWQRLSPAPAEQVQQQSVAAAVPAAAAAAASGLHCSSSSSSSSKWAPFQQQQQVAAASGLHAASSLRRQSPAPAVQVEQQPAAAAAEQPTEKEKRLKAAKRARSLVLLLATLAATITFQAGLDPPGGVWQNNSGGHTAGDPILLTTNPRRYKAFFYCNSVSLVASLVAMVPVESKLLLNHHVLEAVMILDLFGLIGAYAAGSCRDVNTSIHAMALAGAVLVYVVIHVIFITLDDDTRTRSKGDKDSVEKTRTRLLLFAIFVATITYQAGLTPPGGFLQSGGAGHNAGDPVLLYNFPRRYKAFFYCNSVSFMLSIALIILLVNPNVYRPAIRTHALSVCTAAGLFGLMGAFAAGSTQHLKTSVYIFVLLAVVIFFILLLFLVFWCTGCRTSTEGSSNSSTTPQGASHGPEGIAETDSLEVKKKKEHKKRKYLMLLGILVASVTYQAGLTPPGGAWQRSSRWYEAGDPVMHDNRRYRYLAFFYSNSTSFMASVVVILLLLVEKLFDNKTWRSFEKDNKAWRWMRWLVAFLEKKRWFVGFFERKSWLVVMNTTIVLDLLGLLGAYAAGSSRRWKTSVNVLLLVIAVLAYMGFHLLLSCNMMRKRSKQSDQVPQP